MDILVRGNVGPGYYGNDGSQAPLRLGRQGEAVVTEAHGKYFEQTVRGNTYLSSSPLAGVAAGASATANATSATGTWALQNPNGSGYDLVIVRIVMQMLAVGSAQGSHWLCYNQTTTGARLGTGTVSTVIGGLVGTAGKGAVGVPYFGAVLPVLPAAPTAVMPLWSQGTQAWTAVSAVAPQVYDPDGSIVVPQGTILSGQAIPIAAAALTNLVAWTVEWEEVPYPVLS